MSLKISKRSKYTSNGKKLKKNKLTELNSAIEEVESIRGSLNEAYGRFEDITDPYVMEACIYEISALKSKYDCAVRNLKSFFL